MARNLLEVRRKMSPEAQEKSRLLAQKLMEQESQARHHESLDMLRWLDSQSGEPKRSTE